MAETAPPPDGGEEEEDRPWFGASTYPSTGLPAEFEVVEVMSNNKKMLAFKYRGLWFSSQSLPPIEVSAWRPYKDKDKPL